jgi:hypothetical protein
MDRPSKLKQKVSEAWASTWETDDDVSFIAGDTFLLMYFLAAMPAKRIATMPLVCI